MDPTAPLDKLVANKSITPESREWIIAALDPYHDFKVKPVGYPDLSGVDTVVLCINGSMTVAAPSGLSDGETWDCHVFNLPNLAFSHLQPCRYDPGHGMLSYSAGEEAGYKDFGFINAVTTKTGNATLPTAETSDLDAWRTSVTTKYISPELPAGAGRVIAAGFEVTNTTSPLNQQGSVRCYRVSGNTVYTEVFCNTYDKTSNVQTGAVVGTPDAIVDLYTYGPNSVLTTSGGSSVAKQPPRRLCEKGMLPPGTLEDATNVPSSVQWHAKEGGYSVITFNDLDNKLETLSNHALLLVSGDGDSSEVALVSTQAQVAGSTLMHQCNSTFIQPLSISGQYYTGLSPETSLTITMRVYFEFAPSAGNVMMALASPGCPYDDNAFGIYASVVRELPFCVPVKMNSFGSFFRSIGNTLKKIFTGGVVANVGRAVAPNAGKVWDTMDRVGTALRPKTAQANANTGVSKR